MAGCEECGSRDMGEEVLEDAVVRVCRLCGHLHGDEDLVARVQGRREARERGFAPALFPLVRALEAVPTFRVQAASEGRPERGEYPFVFLRVAEGGLRDVECLLTSLEMANRTTRRRWVVECSLQRGLLFILRPRFWKPILEISEKDVTEARSDLAVLARILARDFRLGWWSSPP